MFGLSDLLSLIISAFIILPVVAFLRESGYLVMSELLGAKNPRLTIGTGPRLIKFWIIDIRKYYHIYSWFSYDALKRDSKLAYIFLYASPILINLIVGLSINMLLINGVLNHFVTFWDRFIFYGFYYVLFDAVPMKTVHGKPNNGMIIYQMLRYGKRVDYNKEPFLPSTEDIDKNYEVELENIEKMQKERMESVKKNKKKVT